jgi:hypothetical protein
VRLLEITKVFELGEGVANGRRRHTQARDVHEASRSDRLAGVDVFSNEGAEHVRRTGRKLGHDV